MPAKSNAGLSEKNYRAIFFDAGGTLFKPHPSVGAVYAQVAKRYGMVVQEKEIERLFREEFARRDRLASPRAHSNEKNEKIWWKDLVKNVFERATSLRAFDAFFDELYDWFARAEVWKLYEDALPLLKTLQGKKIVLGIVSNWDSRLFSICEGMGVKPYFDFILASCVVGSAKPDAGIFKEALRLAHCVPEEALHVGDSVENDFFGAKRAGLNALLVNRNGRETGNVETIRSLDGVLEYLKKVPE